IFGTGIGCVGRQTFATWGGDNFGATHGRALAVATGLKLAQPDKKYLIVVGDGDAASIGTSHLIHAARRNLGVTVICEDNMGYESTGGQFSPTTPAGYVTNSSPYGMVEPPFDPCDVVKAAGATFVAETTATQWHQTVKIVKKALGNDGFSFVHVRFPCNENFGAYALGTRDTLKNLEWIYEHTQGRKTDGTETRGGYVRAQLVISPRYVDSPVVENADVFVAFSAPAYRKFFDFCRGKILYDPEMVEEVRSEAPERHVAVAATQISKERF